MRVSSKIEWKKCEVLEEKVNGVFVECWFSTSVVRENIVALIIQYNIIVTAGDIKVKN